MQEKALSIFKPGHNCWTIEQASHASLLIDSANYYRALHQSISKAKRSVFILGWDIDSRIELLRGKDAADGMPVTLFDLVCQKARENPDLKFYLNRWNYSYFFMIQREPFWVEKWNKCKLPNIHVCLDDMVPLGACHHQKLVIIDDEIAFWGGMDIAQGRWDKRQHHTMSAHRSDPTGLPNPEKQIAFGPYHDIQAVAAGPVVRRLADLARDRWKVACPKVQMPPVDIPDNLDLPASWPEKYPPQFRDASMAIARTFPVIKGNRPIHEIAQLFIDEIAQAENFIYIENQYLKHKGIAKAIHRRMMKKPNLRVLCVSCREPQGVMEKKSMWVGRLKFKDIMTQNGTAERFVLAHPASKENGIERSIRIHSKLMIIDDKFLHLGSANIVNRSMGMDTELDMTIIGTDEKICRKIEAIRNDLIREHCGREISDIQHIIEEGLPVRTFLEDIKTSRQHFREINDEKYRKEKLTGIASYFADPKRPFIRQRWTRKSALKPFILLLLFVFLIAALSMIWVYTPLSNYASIEGATALFKKMSDSRAAVLIATFFYTAGASLFFPISIMTAASVIVFGPLYGIVISLTGGLLSAMIGYGIGSLIGKKKLGSLFGNVTGKVMNKIKDAGIAGVTLVRILPAGPYPLVNMVFGASNISFISFMAGTFIGLLPGKIALALTGDGIMKMMRQPKPENIIYLALGILLWVGIVVVSHKIAKRKQGKIGGTRTA